MCGMFTSTKAIAAGDMHSARTGGCCEQAVDVLHVQQQREAVLDHDAGGHGGLLLQGPPRLPAAAVLAAFLTVLSGLCIASNSKPT